MLPKTCYVPVLFDFIISYMSQNTEILLLIKSKQTIITSLPF